jgi:hypothetical protein
MEVRLFFWAQGAGREARGSDAARDKGIVCVSRSFDFGSLVSRLSGTADEWRMAIGNERRLRGGNSIAPSAYAEPILASSATRPATASHPARRGCQQFPLERHLTHGGVGRRIHPADYAPEAKRRNAILHLLHGQVSANSEKPRPGHAQLHKNTTAPRQEAISSRCLDEQRRSTYLSHLEASATKTVAAAVPASKGGSAAVAALVEQGNYRRHSQSDASGEVDFVSPVRKGFQNNTAEYVAMLLRYAKVQEARSPSFRRKSPPPICIPAKAA